ncbi:MAG: VWA domain-containing protein [Vicinamibacterales bacterium]
MRIALVFALTAAVAAAPRDQRPQFRTRVDLVQVDVVVTDRQGNPITGLTAADFAIVEEGRPQVMSQFEAFSIPLGDRQVDRRSTAAARDVATNTEPPSPRALAIVIDSHHLTTDAEELERLRRALAGMLTDISGQDDVAIVFTGRSDLSVPFTRDLVRQVRAINSIKAAAVVRARQSAREAAVAVQTALWTVRNVISVLAGAPHSRRAILYVGEGSVLPLLPPGVVLDEVRMTLEAATRAGVVIYAVDPRGVLDAYQYRVHRVQRDFLSALVLDTGGSVVAGAADTRGEIRKVIRENGAFYVLGYVPEPLWRDDKFHPIEVKVRNPDWRVRARKGYYAPVQIDSEAAAVDPAAAIESALEDGLALSGVPLSATASPVGIAADGKVQTLLTVSLGSSAPPDDLDFAAMALTPDGKVHSTTTERVQARETIHRIVDLSPGVRPLRIAVRNRETGAIGSLHLSLDVPDLKDERLAMGGIMIGSAGVTAAAVDLLTPGFEPHTTRDFGAGDAPALLAYFFWKPEEGEALEVTAAIKRGNTRIAGTRAVVAGSAMESRHRGAFTWPVPLGGLAPGVYEIEVTGEHDSRRVTQAIPIRIR